MGIAQHPLNPGRIVGIVLLAAGVALIDIEVFRQVQIALTLLVKTIF
jgi:hypothetical protein